MYSIATPTSIQCLEVNCVVHTRNNMMCEHQIPCNIVSCDTKCVFFCADDPQLAEFLQLMQPRRAGNIWSNEDALLAQKSSQAATGEAPPQAKSRPKSSVEEAGAPQKAAASQHAQAALRGRKSQAQQASASARRDSLLNCMHSPTSFLAACVAGGLIWLHVTCLAYLPSMSQTGSMHPELYICLVCHVVPKLNK